VCVCVCVCVSVCVCACACPCVSYTGGCTLEQPILIPVNAHAPVINNKHNSCCVLFRSDIRSLTCTFLAGEERCIIFACVLHRYAGFNGQILQASFCGPFLIKLGGMDSALQVFVWGGIINSPDASQGRTYYRNFWLQGVEYAIGKGFVIRILQQVPGRLAIDGPGSQRQLLFSSPVPPPLLLPLLFLLSPLPR